MLAIGNTYIIPGQRYNFVKTCLPCVIGAVAKTYGIHIFLYNLNLNKERKYVLLLSNFSDLCSCVAPCGFRATIAHSSSDGF